MMYERSKHCYVKSGDYVCVGMEIANFKCIEVVTKIKLTYYHIHTYIIQIPSRVCLRCFSPECFHGNT